MSLLCTIDGTPKPYLELISRGWYLNIPACSGERTIIRTGEMFQGFISEDFVTLGLDVIGTATPDTDVEVGMLVRDGKFTDIYNSVDTELDHLVLSQDQMISCVGIYQEFLFTDDGVPIFFLMKVGGKFFVVSVTAYDSLHVSPYQLSHDFVMGRGSRFVFPKGHL